MKTHLIKISAFALLFLVGFTACKKEATTPYSNKNPNLIALKGELPHAPSVEEGILQFDDKEHLNNYLDYIDNIQKTYSEAGEEDINVDDILKSIEDGYIGFNSLRQYELNSFVLGTDEDGSLDYDYDKIENSTITGYTSLKSILNSNKEVIVDNNLVVYLDNNNQIEIKNPELIPLVRESVSSTLDKEVLLEKIREIEFDFGNDGLVLMSATSVLPNIDPSSGSFHSKVLFDACKKKVIIKDIYSSNFSHPCRVYDIRPTININWGDGSPVQVLNSSNTSYQAMWFAPQACDIHNPHRKIKSVEYPYAASTTGTRILTLSTTWWTTPKQYILNFDDAGCTDGSDEKKQSVFANGGNDKLYARLEVINSILTHRVIAESISYKKKNNGNWQKDHAKISTKIVGAIKNNSCSTTSSVDEYEPWNSSKSATIVKGNGAFNTLYYTQFDSEHKRSARNGENMQINLTLKSCY